MKEHVKDNNTIEQLGGCSETGKLIGKNEIMRKIKHLHFPALLVMKLLRQKLNIIPIQFIVQRDLQKNAQPKAKPGCSLTNVLTVEAGQWIYEATIVPIKPNKL